MRYEFKKIPAGAALVNYLSREKASCDPGQECSPDCSPNCGPGYCSPDFCNPQE